MKVNPFRNAQFALSAPELRQLPRDAGAEIAFAGRSNAGKSSALNAICDQTGLARTSKTPGRTQHFVVFALDEGHRLVDLPGYGYAKVPEKMREHWRRTIDAYMPSSIAGWKSASAILSNGGAWYCSVLALNSGLAAADAGVAAGSGVFVGSAPNERVVIAAVMATTSRRIRNMGNTPLCIQVQ